MKKNMEENFEKLHERVKDAFSKTDLERIKKELEQLKGATLVSGVGGSSVVSEFTTKVLNQKNGIVTRNTEPRDFNYLNLRGYKNVLACSYSGNNYGVQLAFNNDLNHYLLASREAEDKSVTSLNYVCEDAEKSFISLGATLIPCSVIFNFYLDHKDSVMEILDNYIKEYSFGFDPECDAYEIFTGLDTSTGSKYLESTMCESGIGIPIVHDKYAYCHGRSTTSTVNDNIAIYFNTGKELDKLLLGELPQYYKHVEVIDVDSTIEGDFLGLVKSMYLSRYIARVKQKDLSGVDYNPIVKKLYKYNGEL